MGTWRSRSFRRYGKRARVVLMAVRDDDAAQLVGVLEHVGVVGQDEVDARMVVVGKHEAGVVEDHVALALEDGHVLADGVKAAERDDLQRGSTVFFRASQSAAACEQRGRLRPWIGVALCS